MNWLFLDEVSCSHGSASRQVIGSPARKMCGHVWLEVEVPNRYCSEQITVDNGAPACSCFREDFCNRGPLPVFQTVTATAGCTGAERRLLGFPC